MQVEIEENREDVPFCRTGGAPEARHMVLNELRGLVVEFTGDKPADLENSSFVRKLWVKYAVGEEAEEILCYASFNAAYRSKKEKLTAYTERKLWSLVAILQRALLERKQPAL